MPPNLPSELCGPPGAAAFDFAGLDRAVADHGVRAQALVEGGQIDEGFEDRAELAVGVLWRG